MKWKFVVVMPSDSKAEFSISAPIGLSANEKNEVMDLVKEGMELAYNKPDYDGLSGKEIKYDFTKRMEDWYDMDVRNQVVGDLEVEILERYTMQEKRWLAQFYDFADAFEFRLSENFFLVYGMVRGPAPKDMSASVSFADVVTRIIGIHLKDLGKQIMEDYVSDHPEALDAIRQCTVPNDFPHDELLGVIPSKLMKYLPEEIAAKAKRRDEKRRVRELLQVETRT